MKFLTGYYTLCPVTERESSSCTASKLIYVYIDLLGVVKNFDKFESKLHTLKALIKFYKPTRL